MIDEDFKNVCKQFINDKYNEYYSTLSQMQQDKELEDYVDIKKQAIIYVKEDIENIADDLIRNL